MQIKKIVLYNALGETRELEFNLGSVSVITGNSKTGKTALIDIVDYCLGREDCPVSEGFIRQRVTWFALLLQFPDYQLLVARRSPGPSGRTSGEIYTEVAETVATPPFSALRATISRTGLQQDLTRRLGFAPNVSEPQNQLRDPLTATIRHALLLNLQRQNTIAQPTLLFHRQGEEGIPMAIRDTLPYLLGVVREDRMARLRTLRQLKAQLRSLERQVLQDGQTTGEGFDRTRSLLQEAVVADLLPAEETEGLDGDAAIQRLRRVLDPRQTVVLPSANSSPSPSLTGLPGQLDQLRQRREELISVQRRLQRELSAVDEFDRDQSGYAGEVREQRARLETVHLLPEPVGVATLCPVCSSPLNAPNPSANALTRAAERLAADLGRIAEYRPALQETRQRLQADIQVVRARLSENRTELAALVQQDQLIQQQVGLETQRLIVKGRISLYLETVPAEIGTVHDARSELERVRRSAEELASSLSEEDAEVQLASVLNLIGLQMTILSKALDLEYSGAPLRLDLKRLTVIADTLAGAVSMDRMGSGENWVGYHLLAHLALHDWFISRSRPVPRFLILDQPTQVYYPNEQAEAAAPDEDRRAVENMFGLVFSFAQHMKGRFQIIIVDHANLPGSQFQGAVVDEFRRGKKLVPSDWPVLSAQW